MNQEKERNGMYDRIFCKPIIVPTFANGKKGHMQVVTSI